MRPTTVLILAALAAVALAAVAAGPSWAALVATWVVALVVGAFVAASEGRRRRAVPIPVRVDRRPRQR